MKNTISLRKSLLFILPIVAIHLPSAHAVQQRVDPQKYVLPISAIVALHSDWSPSTVSVQIAELKRVLRQCQVDVEYDVTYTDQIDRVVEKNFKSHHTSSIAKLAEYFPSKKTLRLFFFNDVEIDGRKRDYSTAFSRALFVDAARNLNIPTSIINTVWLPIDISKPSQEGHCGNAKYSIISHEAVHVLTSIGTHSPYPQPNLLELCMTGRRSNDLTDEQCRSITTHPLVSQKNSP